MKKIHKITVLITAVITFSACSNIERQFDDYLYTADYFPYQYPVRTLILGDYIYDNDNDNAHKFVISVAMGGVYDNRQDREFKIAVDESLCSNLLFSAGGSEVKALPSNYYTLASETVIIPRGKVNGGVDVQLDDAFFDDPLAIDNTYVVPLKIIASSGIDTVLLSKNFTLFAVKFINEYHGTYFRYGTGSVKDPQGTVIENTAYNTEKYVENNPVLKLLTTGRHQVSASFGFQSRIFTGTLSLLLDFNGNSCTVSAPPGSAYTVTGSGEFKSKAYEWGNKERDGIVLNYTVTDSKGSYTAGDTLVIRDRSIVMELFSPVAKN
jgi:hypothetical protein